MLRSNPIALVVVARSFEVASGQQQQQQQQQQLNSHAHFYRPPSLPTNWLGAAGRPALAVGCFGLGLGSRGGKQRTRGRAGARPNGALAAETPVEGEGEFRGTGGRTVGISQAPNTSSYIRTNMIFNCGFDD